MRVPIWCAVAWPHRAPLRRAARWDGVVPVGRLAPTDVAAMRAEIATHRTTAEAFDIVLPTAAASSRAVADYEAAGATWWLVSLDARTGLDELHAIVADGPPRP